MRSKSKLKFLILIGLIASAYLVWGSSVFAIQLPGPYFAAKFQDMTFADFDYLTYQNYFPFGGYHPAQDSTPSDNVWGIYALTGVFEVTNNKPETPTKGYPPYYMPGEDGKYYFGVYGGLTLYNIGDPDNDGDPDYIDLVPVYDQYGNNQSYLKIYEVTDPTLYNQALQAGPNATGEGAFGTFGNEIINNGVLWLEAKFDTELLHFYSNGTIPFGVAERLNLSSTTSGKAEAYLDVVGGIAASTLDQDVFPFSFSLPGFTADLKLVSDITTYNDQNGWTDQLWTSKSDDPISGAVPEPATMFLLGSGLLGMVGFGRKRLMKKAN